MQLKWLVLLLLMPCFAHAIGGKYDCVLRFQNGEDISHSYPSAVIHEMDYLDRTDILMDGKSLCPGEEKCIFNARASQDVQDEHDVDNTFIFAAERAINAITIADHFMLIWHFNERYPDDMQIEYVCKVRRR